MTDQIFSAGILGNRAIIEVEGRDARGFLQNILTCDIKSLQERQIIYGALLTPQGKILFDCFVNCFTEDLFRIDCAVSRVEEVVKRLKFYRLRANIEIARNPDSCVVVWPDEPQDFLDCFPDPRTPQIGWRAVAIDISKHGGPPLGYADATGYDETRIALGLADSDDIGSGELFPHEANFDQLGAVSFTKGCYIGQEVVSRMEHRGTARNRILPVSLAGAAPARGAEIRSGDKLVGTLLSSRGTHALALIRLDRLAEADAPLLTDGVAVTVHKPAWVRYDVPGAILP